MNCGWETFVCRSVYHLNEYRILLLYAIGREVRRGQAVILDPILRWHDDDDKSRAEPLNFYSQFIGICFQVAYKAATDPTAADAVRTWTNSIAHQHILYLQHSHCIPKRQPFTHFPRHHHAQMLLYFHTKWKYKHTLCPAVKWAIACYGIQNGLSGMWGHCTTSWADKVHPAYRQRGTAKKIITKKQYIKRSYIKWKMHLIFHVLENVFHFISFQSIMLFSDFRFIHNVHSDGSHCILTVFVFYISFFESFPHQGVSRWWLAGWMVPLYHVDGWVQFSFWWMQWVIELSLNRVEADEWKKWVQRLNMHSTDADNITYNNEDERKHKRLSNTIQWDYKGE